MYQCFSQDEGSPVSSELCSRESTADWWSADWGSADWQRCLRPLSSCDWDKYVRPQVVKVTEGSPVSLQGIHMYIHIYQYKTVKFTDLQVTESDCDSYHTYSSTHCLLFNYRGMCSFPVSLKSPITVEVNSVCVSWTVKQCVSQYVLQVLSDTGGMSGSLYKCIRKYKSDSTLFCWVLTHF